MMCCGCSLSALRSFLAWIVFVLTRFSFEIFLIMKNFKKTFLWKSFFSIFLLSRYRSWSRGRFLLTFVPEWFAVYLCRSFAYLSQSPPHQERWMKAALDFVLLLHVTTPSSRPWGRGKQYSHEFDHFKKTFGPNSNSLIKNLMTRTMIVGCTGVSLLDVGASQGKN